MDSPAFDLRGYKAVKFSPRAGQKVKEDFMSIDKSIIGKKIFQNFPANLDDQKKAAYTDSIHARP